MRLKQYLNEETDISEYLPILKKDCSQIMRLAKKGFFLYRGFKNVPIDDNGEKSTFFDKTPRTGRMPLDTSTAMHKIMDEYFNEKFNWRARSEGLFCTTSYSHAKFYGDVYLIFPVNAFKFIYSPNVHDLFDEQNRFIKKEYNSLYGFLAKAKTNTKEVEAAVFSMLDNLKYTDKNLQKAAKNNSEVMIKCSKYYALSEKWSSILINLSNHPR